jgi:hypothetical protein
VELLYRARQEAGKFVDRTWRSGVPVDRLHVDAAHRLYEPPVHTRPSRLFEGEFFPGAMHPTTPALIRVHCPDAVERVLARAERILAGRFDLLGYDGLSFGEPIDWHLDPVSSRRAPRVHWSGLDPLDPEAVGDSKVTWELSRHQWLVTLAVAYRLTGDDRYARHAAWAFRSWVAANPPGVGLNWASSLEAAFRLIAWCWMTALLRDAPTMTSRLHREIAAAAAQQAEHVARYLSYYFSPNTHLTGEALGLFYAGVLLRSRRARRWSALGYRILVEESERQIHPDGVYFEHATCYQRYTAEIYLHFLGLARANGISVPAAVTERTTRLLDCLLALCRPDGGMPQIGDADGGWLLPLTPRGQEDCRGVFAAAAVLFERPAWAWMAGGPAPEAFWLAGGDAAGTLERISRRPGGSPSRLFGSGYAVMRDSWDADAHQLVMDAGPLGCHLSSGHGHADLLAIQVSPFGEPCIVDPGTGCYTGAPVWRDHFRSTRAHPTVAVDGGEYAEPAGAFSWSGRKPAVRVRHWHSTPRWDFIDAQHDGWSGDTGRILHRRRVFFRKGRYWIVADDVAGTGTHDADVRFQFADVTLAIAGRAVRARTPSGGGLWLVPFASAPLATLLACGAEDPLDGWYSPDYGRVEPAPAVVFAVRGAALPVRVLTVLVPAREGTPPPALAPVRDETGMPCGVHVVEDGERVIFDDTEHVSVSVHGAPLRPSDRRPT